MQIIFSLEEISEVTEKILSENPHKIILFKGEMGAGKTTLIKELAKILKVKNTTSSPTFSLVNEYQSVDNHIIYHFDFYRLKSEIEALDMGVEEYFYSNNWCFIEWPEKIPNLIPIDHSLIEINTLPDGKRQLIFS